ncbi:MAG: hypothetical protein WBX25_30020, partial [Rhodomicrobium sp.]
FDPEQTLPDKISAWVRQASSNPRKKFRTKALSLIFDQIGASVRDVSVKIAPLDHVCCRAHLNYVEFRECRMLALLQSQRWATTVTPL